MGKLKCFSLKYMLAVSIWNCKNLVWKIFSSNKLRSTPFAVFSYCRQNFFACFCIEIFCCYWHRAGWCISVVGHGHQSRGTKMSQCSLVSIPAVSAQAAAQGSVVWTHLQAHITNPTDLGLKVSSLSCESLKKNPSLCPVLTRAVPAQQSCPWEAPSPRAAWAPCLGLVPSSSHSLDSVKGVGCSTRGL